MEDIFGLILGLGLAVIIAIFVIIFQTNRKKKKWTGVVTKIRSSIYYPNEDMGSQTEYIIHYRTDSGQNKKFRINEDTFRNLFSTLQAGDRLEKVPGEFYPRIKH